MGGHRGELQKVRTNFQKLLRNLKQISTCGFAEARACTLTIALQAASAIGFSCRAECPPEPSQAAEEINEALKGGAGDRGPGREGCSPQGEQLRLRHGWLLLLPPLAQETGNGFREG